jgi:hypothetical protein
MFFVEKEDHLLVGGREWLVQLGSQQEAHSAELKQVEC